MGIGPFELGAAGLLVGGVIAVLVAAAVVTVLVLLMWTVALTVVAPAMGGAAVEARHSQQRAWFKRVKESWRAAPPQGTAVDEPAPPPHRREIRGVGVVGDQDAGAQTQLLAAQVARSGVAGPSLDPMAIMRVTLKPDHQLVLPPHPHCDLAVVVLSGRGVVGVQGEPVRGGQVALHGRRSAVRVTAAPAGQRVRPLELLVVPQAPGESTLVPDEPLVRPIGAGVRHQLRVLQILTADLPLPGEPLVAAPAAAPGEPAEPAPQETQGEATAQPVRPAVPAA